MVLIAQRTTGRGRRPPKQWPRRSWHLPRGLHPRRNPRKGPFEMREKRTSPARPRSSRPGLTPAERTMRARLAAHVQWSREADPTARTSTARTAFLTRFEAEVDPEGILAPEERARRAEHARKAHFARLALASAKARRLQRAERASASTAASTDRAQHPAPEPEQAPEGGEAA